MSSILKALKKLDDELPRKRRTVIWSSGSTAHKTIRRWDIGAGRSTIVLWGLLVLAVLAAAGGMYLYLKAGPGNLSGKTVAVTRPISKPDQAQAPPGPVTGTSTGIARPQQPETAAPAPRPTPPPASQPQRAEPAPRPASPAATQPQKAETAAPARKAPVEKKAAKPKAPAAASLPILTATLKLQAISWAPAAGDRLAVINGNIVREGASLEGYVIVQIDREEVRVRKDAEQWKLVFDLK